MRIYLMAMILVIMSCNNTHNPMDNTANAPSDSLDMTASITDTKSAEPGSVIFETNKLLNQINTTNNCHFEYAESKAPNKDIAGEANIMQAEIDELEAQKLISLFYKKCHDNELEKFNTDQSFWTKGKYNLKAYFNVFNPQSSYFTCLIKDDGKYAYYTLGNP
ncbi:MAG: hypothetical protein GC192_24305 [Bacteroidetes bacterium]|nr:hypothetical protein [Bacteroidota bacterium]